jgi:predicted nuclease with TOPRIM domain
LKDKIRQLNSDKEIVLQQYQEVKEAYEAVHARLEGVEKENFSLLAIVDENNKFIGKLKGESEVVRKNGE